MAKTILGEEHVTASLHQIPGIAYFGLSYASFAKRLNEARLLVHVVCYLVATRSENEGTCQPLSVSLLFAVSIITFLDKDATTSDFSLLPNGFLRIHYVTTGWIRSANVTCTNFSVQIQVAPTTDKLNGYCTLLPFLLRRLSYRVPFLDTLSILVKKVQR